MEAAETQLARALAALIEHEFPLSRGMEKRLDAYLQLEDLQRLEDSEASVVQLQKHLSSLLNELRLDLQQNTVSDVVHAALRCLSYFMYHHSLAATFSDDHLAFFLGELIRRLFSTSDRTTCKLCLWCLTVQNFPVERHAFLPRIAEGLVQAVVNPFQSRAIELQALKGLHLLLVKYPEQLGASRSVLSIYIRPIASRLSSNEASTRTQARLVLDEVSKHVATWSKKTLEMVQDCTEKYILPAMKCHMDRGRQKDAVSLWKLTLILLRSRFSSDLKKLNQVLYVPEKCIKDEDAAVRLMAMHAWAGIVDIFHDGQNWFFNKAVVRLLAGPIKVCLGQERLLNVVDAAFLSWRRIVSVAVQDFNTYCKAQQQCIEEAGQPQFVPEWKSWYGELVMSPQLTLMIKRFCTKDSSSIEVELKQFTDFAKRIWEPGVPESGKRKSGPSYGESSISTIMDGSFVDGLVALKQQENVGGLISTGDQACDQVCITSELFGVAFLLEDIFSDITSLLTILDEKSNGKLVKRHAYDLAMTVWNGVCQRVLSGITRETSLQASKFALRLVRMAIDFSFGILTLRSASAVMPVPSKVAVPTDQSGENIEDEVVISSVGFGLELQLQFLVPLVSGIACLSDLQAVVLHPKCKLFDHITQRMGYLKEMYSQCSTVLEKWNCSEDSELRLDFSVKSNVLSYLVMNLLFEYAVFVDDMIDYGCRAKSTLASLDIVFKELMLSTKLSSQQEVGLEATIRYGEEFIRAAYEHIACGKAGSEGTIMLDELVSVCKNLTEHTYKSQQNASLLLDLHQSRKKYGAVSLVTARTPSFPNGASDAGEKSADTVAHEAEHLSPSFDANASSSCSLRDEVSTFPGTSSAKQCSASVMDEQPMLHHHSHPGSHQSSGKSFDPNGAPTTLRNTGDSEQNDAERSSKKALLIRPFGCQLASQNVAVERAHCPNLNTSQCIYPGLVGCTEKIASLYRHFSVEFRPLFSLYNIRTVGDLSALSVEKVRTFELENSVSTVRRVLEDFNRRKDPMKSSTGNPFRQRNVSTTASPTIPTSSSHRPTKRPFHVEGVAVSLLPLETREHKRTKRSLVLDVKGGKEEQESKKTRRKPDVTGKVTLCFQCGEAGETRSICPGEDLLHPINPSEKIKEKEIVQAKMDTYTLKLLQHLRRSAYYMEKLVTEEESMQSGEASLQANVATVGGVITNYREAHDLVARLASQLQIAAETSSKRCCKLLEKFVST